MALERTYVVPLRKYTIRVPRYKKANKAIRGLRSFLSRHMKAKEEDIKIGKYLNEAIWRDGIRSPPPRIQVNVKKDDKGVVTAELVGAPVKQEEKAPKKESKEGSAAETKEKPAKEEKKPEKAETKEKPAKEEKKPEAVIKSASKKKETVEQSTSDLAKSAQNLNKLAKDKHAPFKHTDKQK